jgi:hypothetical protein
MVLVLLQLHPRACPLAVSSMDPSDGSTRSRRPIDTTGPTDRQTRPSIDQIDWKQIDGWSNQLWRVASDVDAEGRVEPGKLAFVGGDLLALEGQAEGQGDELLCVQ